MKLDSGRGGGYRPSQSKEKTASRHIPGVIGIWGHGTKGWFGGQSASYASIRTLSSDTHGKALAAVGTWNPSTGERRQVDPRILMASQPSQNCDIHVQ